MVGKRRSLRMHRPACARLPPIATVSSVVAVWNQGPVLSAATARCWLTMLVLLAVSARGEAPPTPTPPPTSPVGRYVITVYGDVGSEIQSDGRFDQGPGRQPHHHRRAAGQDLSLRVEEPRGTRQGRRQS